MLQSLIAGPLAPCSCSMPGAVLWVVGYDTIYAIQDMADDVQVRKIIRAR